LKVAGIIFPRVAKCGIQSLHQLLTRTEFPDSILKSFPYFENFLRTTCYRPIDDGDNKVGEMESLPPYYPLPLAVWKVFS